MKEVMFLLAENYKLGILVSTGVAVAIYVLVSVLSVLSARRRGINATISAMIPFWHLKYFFCKPKF